MKVSKEQKQETRQAIIRSAVEIMMDKGIKSATMRQIARAAGIGDATIYNYFPAKEDILFAYYGDHLDACAAKTESMPGADSFTLQEYMQAFLEMSLEMFLGDREFVDMSFRDIFFSMSHNYSRLKPIRRRFVTVVEASLERAEESGDIPELLFGEIVVQLFWDFYVVTVMHWLSDRSQGFSDTTVMIDKSLDLACTVLRSGLMDKAFDMAVFMIKNHLLSKMEFVRERVNVAHRVKETIFGRIHGQTDTGN
ncbi:MAG: TetR family transcriptional regulator [Pseudomonadota bacterium]